MTRRSEPSALEKLLGGPVTFADALAAIRKSEGQSLAEFGARLKVSRSHMHDLESGRRTTSIERAAAFAVELGYSEAQFIRLVLQDQIDASGLRFCVTVAAAS